MPNAYLEKLSKEGHGSMESLESKWATAKKSAEEKGEGKNYAYIVGILKHMLGITASVEVASPIKPGSPRETAAKNKTAQIATKLLAEHLRPTRTLLVKDLHVTHSWGDKPARNFANPHYAYTVLSPAKKFSVSMDDQIAVARGVKAMYKDIGPVMVFGTQHGMLVSVPFNTGLAHTELLDDLYS